MNTEIPFYILFLSYPMQLFISLLILNKINAGFAIILLSILIRFCLYPIEKKINIYSKNKAKEYKRIKNLVKEKVKKLKGEEKFLITNKIYKENNYHPIYEMKLLFGLFIQIPFFLAAYFALTKTAIFNYSEFFFIKDLSEPDRLVDLIYININILPFFMTVLNIFAVYNFNKLLRNGLVDYIMPVIFLIILYDQPSCIVLYWTTNNFIYLIQTIKS